MSVEKTTQGENVLAGYCPKALNHYSSDELYLKSIGKTLPEDNLFIVLGSDSGLIIEYLKKIQTKGQRFIILDYQVVLDFIGHEISSDFDKNIELRDIESFDFESLYEKYQDFTIRNAIVLVSSLSVQEAFGPYKTTYKSMKEAFHRFRIDRVDNRDYRSFYNKQLSVVCDLMHPISRIKEKLAGNIPGIILGGGPSLDEIIPWLKCNQDKVWIFSAGRICKRLLDEGITPDFIGSIDYQDLMFDFSKEMYSFQETSVLLTGEHPNSRIIRQWSGLKAYSRSRFPWGLKNQDNFIHQGPTISNTLIGMAAYLGVKQLYLSGVDFCFTLEGLCHESGSIESKSGVSNILDTQIKNYKGEEVGTNIQLYDARNQLEQQITEYTKTWPYLKVHNLSLHSAVIEGIDYVSLEKIALEEDKDDVVNLFKDALHYDISVTEEFYKALESEMKYYSKKLYQIIKESKIGLHQTKELFNDPTKEGQRVKKLLKQKKKLEKLVGDDYTVMVNYGYKSFMTTLKPVDTESEMSQQEITNSFIGFFSGLESAAVNFLEQFELIMLEISKRRIELSADTSFEVLVENWTKENVPGRFFVWLKHYASNSYEFYKQNYPKQVELLESAFESLVSDNSKLEELMNDKLDNPEEFLNRLHNAFEHNRIHNIDKEIIVLNSIHKKEFEPIKMFAKGLHLELEMKKEQALAFYQKFDTKREYDFIQERVYELFFSFHKFNEGLEVLQNLCSQNERYIPKFASSLAILGNTDGAIEMYKVYPLLFQDTDAMIDLLKLYVSNDKIAEANTLLAEVAESPDLDHKALQVFVDSLNK